MRLLRVEDLKLVEFLGPNIPGYAILSHTWDDEEITYQEITAQRPELNSKKGFAKILGACKQALKDSHSYIWIDTCCIDKSSSAELTEAINSMYGWYRNAEVCYAFLSDVSYSVNSLESLTKSRWFTRGWTLQGLLAPRQVIFYDSTWNKLGSKFEFAQTISTSTGIELEALRDSSHARSCSVAMKMSWAADRQTTRTEDLAYCLLGMFDVNMALLYGEGHKAFRRLQEEIVKRKNDLTIFAWDRKDPYESIGRVLAPSASHFRLSASIEPFGDDNIDFSITNKGVRIAAETMMRTIQLKSLDGNSTVVTYLLLLGSVGYDRSNQYGGVCLRKIGPHVFSRDPRCPLAGFDRNEFEVIYALRVRDYYICTDLEWPKSELQAFYRQDALHVPPNSIWKLKESSPEILWDETDQLFLNADAFEIGPRSMMLFARFTAMFEHTQLTIVAVCEYVPNKPVVSIFEDNDSTSRLVYFVFNTKRQYKGVTLTNLKASGLELPSLSSVLSIKTNDRVIRVSVVTENGRISLSDRSGNMSVGSRMVECFHLVLKTHITYTSEIGITEGRTS